MPARTARTPRRARSPGEGITGECHEPRGQGTPMFPRNDCLTRVDRDTLRVNAPGRSPLGDALNAVAAAADCARRRFV
jgi:hypothetical protein